MTHRQPQVHEDTATSPQTNGKRILRTAIAIALGITFFGSILAQQGSATQTNRARSRTNTAVPHLVVSGTTGTVGMDADHDDELVFADGNFHSRECSKLGFTQSRASVHRDGDVIRFSAVNVSPKYGTLSWEGVIRNGIVEALYVWKKERLFWTIQREYWFSGEIENAVF
ncbi:MAG: hypothetical protein PVH25_14130 [Burkholderiales bacterium]|jgi:hypothetical protein